MKYLGFSISNFKGIKQLDFDFNNLPNSNIYLLVGLNECGKTTIMEALSFFYENVSTIQEENAEIVANTLNDRNIHSLIPKNKKDNFNDSIQITAKI